MTWIVPVSVSAVVGVGIELAISQYKDGPSTPGLSDEDYTKEIDRRLTVGRYRHVIALSGALAVLAVTLIVRKKMS